LLADAAEAQGDFRRAYEYGEKARKIWFASGKTHHFAEIVACYRREATELMKARRPHEAARTLSFVPEMYVAFLEYSGINHLELYMLRDVMAAVQVLAEALVLTGVPHNNYHAGRMRGDVEETEAILSAYWEGVLEETRRELGEQRAAAAAAMVAEAVAAVAEVEDAGAAALSKKSKAAKRKQQKKAAEMVEAAAVAAAARRDDETQGLEEKVEQQQKEQADEEEEESETENEQSDKQAVTAAATALATMAVTESKEKKVEEEEEEEECLMCLNEIDSKDTDNPAGPALVCGHRYHAFCLHFWAEKCASKCIEATCPYCRAPLGEMEDNGA
jgi:hypothetical protein